MALIRRIIFQRTAVVLKIASGFGINALPRFIGGYDVPAVFEYL